MKVWIRVWREWRKNPSFRTLERRRKGGRKGRDSLPRSVHTPRGEGSISRVFPYRIVSRKKVINYNPSLPFSEVPPLHSDKHEKGTLDIGGRGKSLFCLPRSLTEKQDKNNNAVRSGGCSFPLDFCLFDNISLLLLHGGNDDGIDTIPKKFLPSSQGWCLKWWASKRLSHEERGGGRQKREEKERLFVISKGEEKMKKGSLHLIIWQNDADAANEEIW